VLPVYSERFLNRGGNSGWTYYTVPPGKRAVITMVTSDPGLNSGHGVQVLAAGYSIYRSQLPANADARFESLRVPVYQGEQIGLYTQGATATCTVSGYLLTDTTGRSGPPASASSLPSPAGPEAPFG
jgi:hypothetical protein